MRKVLMSVAFLCVGGMAFIYCPASEARSLWNDNANWIADQRPSRVGDIVMVLVDEQTDTRDRALTDVSKSSNSSVSNGLGILSFIRQIGLDTANDAKGEASIERRHHARTTIPCIVTDVLPNGNMVIEGTRDVQTSDETLQVQLVGVIRPQDVNANNQIRSSLIANVEIGVKGRGSLSRTQKPGIITQVLQAIF
ncbi:MAG: flagellar basal body L-ring protein FlgH [Synergistaceae bacterium]|nr:flagellar basal body L-ring protein FlgH [Synergistaceae bacterium]